MQLRYTSSQPFFRHGDGVVEIHGTGGLHSVLIAQDNLRWDTSDRRSNGRNGDRRQIFDRAVSREHHNRPLLVRRSKKTETNISSIYSSGHDAIASHNRTSR